jgi:hypothetical protein
MTPHRHWLRNYSPKRVPIKLADNTVVYSAGVGSVVFHPTLEGKRGRAVEFSNILHVPQLRNNLLAVLYLTRRSSFDVHINATHMSFSRSNGPPLFVAPINEHNAAFLDGVTEAITEYASPATTVPLDLALWHRRLAHHNLTDVKVLSMVIALSMSRACQPHGGALLLCMVVSDSIHRTCKSDVSAL